jgi:hypothetical protein
MAMDFLWRYDANYKEVRMSLDDGKQRKVKGRKEKRKEKNAKTH